MAISDPQMPLLCSQRAYNVLIWTYQALRSQRALSGPQMALSGSQTALSGSHMDLSDSQMDLSGTQMHGPIRLSESQRALSGSQMALYQAFRIQMALSQYHYQALRWLY
jgi:hypothetical protein